MHEHKGSDLHKRSAVMLKRNRRGEIREKATVPTTAVAHERYFSRQAKCTLTEARRSG